jgi:hypothetical protein
MDVEDFERCVWVGNFGTYIIPKELRYFKYTKNGWFDRRRGMDYYKPLTDWLTEMGEKDFMGVTNGN